MRLNKVYCQNLVPNPSFEIDTACPNNYSQIYYAVPWFQPHIFNGNTSNSSSTDILDSCAQNYATVGVPCNSFGDCLYPRTGGGDAGFFPIYDTLNYHEYLEVPLTSSLLANHRYCVEFYLSLSLSMSDAAISNLGAYFSIDSLLDTTHWHAINYVIPQVENPIGVYLTSTLWTLVSGSFIANGGEKFMTIGNFHLFANTDVIPIVVSPPSLVSYYYIDDVSVVDCMADGVNENNKEDMVEVYPNPATNSLTLTLNKGEGIVALYNVLGECVLTTSIVNHKKEIDISFLPKGVYFVNVKSDTQSMNRKFIKE